MKSFEGKVAAITGAASGMGRSLAVGLARRGCHVALSDVNEAALEETVKLATGAGAGRVKVTAKRVDVGVRNEIYTWAEGVVRDHGKCNLIFNNAGVGHSATARSADDEDLEWIFRINFWGVVHGTRAFLPLLEASGEGHIINISSLFGLLAFPGQSSYNATKFAVRGYTEALRIELEMTGSPVSATCVHPGGIKTNIARGARVHASLAELGVTDLAQSSARFEKAFRVTADEAAEVILRGVQRNARRVLVGSDAHIFDLLQRLMPTSYQWIVAKVARRAISGS